MSFVRVFLVVAILLLATGTASGRQTSLFGSISLLQEYDSNVNLSETNVESGWSSVLSPSIILTSESEHDILSFGYAPGLQYNYYDESTEVNHYLTLEGTKLFSKRFSANFTENYLRSNDYTYFVTEYVRQPGAGVPLSALEGRNNYWTNGVAVSADYEYANNSILGLGYSNEILNNDSPNQDDYVKNHPYLSASYQFNPKWGTVLSYDYIQGDFTLSEDLNEHVVGAVANYQWTRHELLFGSFQFDTLDYEGSRSGYNLYRSDLGWQHQLGPHSALETAAGASYVDPERGDSEMVFNYVVDYRREIKWGRVSFGGRGGMDQLQFDASENTGLSRFWSVRGDLQYQLSERFNSQIYASYREDTFLEVSPEYTDDSLVAGTSLSLAFHRWYAFVVGYSFRQLNSTLPGNDYDDHRLYVQLNMGKELKRWL
ncbi:MAG: hypothetical protein P8Y63_15525 [Deltaproteobacteria bacterium]